MILDTSSMANQQKMKNHLLKLQALTGLQRWLPRWLLPLLAMAWFSAAWGETLSNPTLPPPAWVAAQSSARGVALPIVDQEQGALAGMQVILIGPSRKFAMIDGQMVKPGDMYNGSKVLAIRPGEVVLQDSSKSLKLNSSVEKKLITPVPPRKTVGKASRNKVLVKGNGGRP